MIDAQPDTVPEGYEPPRAEDLDVSDGPALTCAMVTTSDPTPG